MHYPFALGSWTRPVTPDREAQTWFDRGLNWLYGFNHEEAVACFHRALEHDRGCAMAWWGIAYAAGPFYNRPWTRFSDEEIEIALLICFRAAANAKELAAHCNPADTALIVAIAKRYQSPEMFDRAVLDSWHREFTDAMREVHRLHPDDLDIAALFAEAAVTCTPRLLWDMTTGQPSDGALTEEALGVLERAMETINATEVIHPGIPHMLIHALEMSPYPERALPAADMLCGYAPDAGHLEHMPAHIYVICGDYAQALEQSKRAVSTDDKYLDFAGVDNFYSTARCHDLHLYMYAAMFIGQYRSAMYAADRICAIATEDLIERSAPFMGSILDGYSAMRTHVLVRFGKWDELTREPAPPKPETTPIRYALHAYGEGVGHANLRQFSQAERARELFQRAAAEFSEDAIISSNPVVNVLAVGQAMLDGELAYHRGDYESAFEHLRLAVSRDDRLNYSEPWPWMHPPRHALGALLLEQGQYEEAEAVYRVDLGLANDATTTVPRCCSHPDNIWSLVGLLECVNRRGVSSESALLSQRLAVARARTDFEITSSCCCRPH